MYNDTSCVACHNLGGAGGGGPRSKNVHFVDSAVTPILDIKSRLGELRAKGRDSERDMLKRRGRTLPPFRTQEGELIDREALIKLHAGFRSAASVGLHRYGPEADYEEWRLGVLNPHSAMFGLRGSATLLLQRSVTALSFLSSHEYGHFTLSVSERNPPPLFGAGLIDAIPDEVLEQGATRKRDHLEVHGHVSRLPAGRIGRFGWKAQAATLDDFVLTACAEELGLQVPGHPQAENPRAPGQRARGLDLTRADCDALTTFVAALPAPVERAAATRLEREQIGIGRIVFGRVGCAACHVPSLGKVDGIYSDLLLHDMGDELGASGGYASLNTSPEDDSETLPGIMPNGPMAFRGTGEKPNLSAQERSRQWRTAPLWGLRDSAPYLHDGRADTVEQAIAFHGGEARFIARRYFTLAVEERRAVERFLKSLTAPAAPDLGHRQPEVPNFAVPPPAVTDAAASHEAAPAGE